VTGAGVEAWRLQMRPLVVRVVNSDADTVENRPVHLSHRLVCVILVSEPDETVAFGVAVLVPDQIHVVDATESAEFSVQVNFFGKLT